jgi:signal transduction histidine kinase
MDPKTSRGSRQDVSKRISDNTDEILKLWMDRVRLEVPGAATLDKQTLVDRMAEFMKRLGEVVSTAENSPSGERSSIETLKLASEHGINRASLPIYTLDQVISEYRILRQILLSFLNATGGLEPREEEKLLESIDYGVMEASVQFTATLGFKRAKVSDAERGTLKQELAQARQRVKSVSLERDFARTETDRAHVETDELTRAMTLLRLEREMRERFVSALTHDLRTPLTAVFTRAQLIRRLSDNPERVRELSSQIARDIERANRMIRDLLDASLIRAGEKLHLNFTLTNLTQLAGTVLKDLTLLHGDRFVLDAPPKVDAFVDPDGITRIIENLCNNAVKYGARETPIIVSLQEQGSQVQIAVHNEGPSLSLPDRKSLFEQYRRTSTAKAGEQKGWGLGLTLVKGMAESHGGTVKVRSSENEGTTFTVLLPRDSRRIQGASHG